MFALPGLPDPYAQWFINATDEARLTVRYGQLPQVASDPASCPTCRGRKSFRFYRHFELGPMEDGQEIVDYACACRDQALLQRWLYLRGVERYLGGYYFGDLWGVERGTRDFLADYIDKLDRYLDHARGFLLHGRNGNGKSLVACLALKHCAQTGRSVYWAIFAEMLNLYTAGFDSRDDKLWFETQVQTADVLVLDDVGQEHDKRSIAKSAFDHVLRTRVQAGLTTIVTTNLELEGIGQHYGASIESLLLQACMVHRLTGTDWRRSHFANLVDYEVNHDIKRPFSFGVF